MKLTIFTIRTKLRKIVRCNLSGVFRAFVVLTFASSVHAQHGEIRKLPSTNDRSDVLAFTNASNHEQLPLDPNHGQFVAQNSACAPHSLGEVPYDPTAFGDDPDYSGFEYNPDVETDVYTGSYLNPTQRPWIELGRGMYQPGPIMPSDNWLGDKNLIAQHFLLYGDYRVGFAYNDNGAKDRLVSAHRLNLDLDWKITATERIHAFIGPLDRGTNFTRTEFDRGELDFFEEFDDDFDTIFFEGDLGYLYGGMKGIDAPFDLPFAAGLFPLLFQNGVWIEDAFIGAIATIPAKYCEPLNWSNYDLAFFVGFDEINSPAFGTDDSAANVYGVHSAIDVCEGYLEVGYAFLDDSIVPQRSYHNLGVSFSRRYFHRVSNAVRVIVNAGQGRGFGPQTADGQLVIFENAFISNNPNFFVPYVNLFAGFGSPQSVARAGVAGGVLRNVGINFETDGLTGYPFIDDTGNNTVGGAAGLNILCDNFACQFIFELAWLQTHGRAVNRRAVDDQFAIGARYQKPISNAWIFRCDAMHGFYQNANDVSGIRTEFRYKF